MVQVFQCKKEDNRSESLQLKQYGLFLFLTDQVKVRFYE